MLKKLNRLKLLKVNLKKIPKNLMDTELYYDCERSFQKNVKSQPILWFSQPNLFLASQWPLNEKKLWLWKTQFQLRFDVSLKKSVTIVIQFCLSTEGENRRVELNDTSVKKAQTECEVEACEYYGCREFLTKLRWRKNHIGTQKKQTFNGGLIHFVHWCMADIFIAVRYFMCAVVWCSTCVIVRAWNAALTFTWFGDMIGCPLNMSLSWWARLKSAFYRPTSSSK